MQTRCPHCATIFVIAAAHLRAAHGQVKCGRCTRVFDAIPHLIDDLSDAASKADDDDVTEGAGAATPLPAPASPPRSIGPFPDVDARPPGQVLVTVAEGDVPEVLHEDLADTERAPPSAWRGPAYLAGGFALLVMLVLQYAWFEPLDLVKRYPQALGTLERWCAFTGCSLTGRHEPDRIRVITRDVRVHPRYEGALQVTATLVNTAPYSQPYPRVQFSVFNVNGQTIASRTFESHEYLGALPPPGSEFAPRSPLQIALEMLAPEEAAISFEFRFL